MNNQDHMDLKLPAEFHNEQQMKIREESKDLAKAMNNVYNKIVFNCQKSCLKFDSAKVSKEETQCLMKCANENMFLDNFLYEVDTASQLAATEGKPKKAAFYINRRIEDATASSNNPIRQHF